MCRSVFVQRLLNAVKRNDTPDTTSLYVLLTHASTVFFFTFSYERKLRTKSKPRTAIAVMTDHCSPIDRRAMSMASPVYHIAISCFVFISPPLTRGCTAAFLSGRTRPACWNIFRVLLELYLYGSLCWLMKDESFSNSGSLWTRTPIRSWHRAAM